MKLYYSFISASYTNALVIVDEEGCVYYASLGDSEYELIGTAKKILAKRGVKIFPNPESTKVQYVKETFRSLIENPTLNSGISLEYKMPFATPFQRKILNYLKNEIKASQVISYSDLAMRMKIPTSCRAVSNACASNMIAILIPCHRVTTKSGQHSGYRWGIPLKKKILELEKSTIKAL